MIISRIRITEMMCQPPVSETLEFVELRNVGASTVDLSGLAFTDGIDFAFPAALLAPGDHALVVADLAAFTTFYGPVSGVLGEYAGQLGNGGERLRLEDAAGNVIQEFRYDDRWHPSSDGQGYSLVIREATADKKLWGQASGWRASTFVGGSAGTAELRLCADGIDNDGDGLSDYPADPGCADANQDFEDPQCDDGADNDGDALVDTADPDCALPSRDSEEANPIDSFVCYAAKTTSKTPKFRPIETVLTDRFEAGSGTLVRKPSMLCLPAELNGHLNDNPVGILDEGTHLEAYSIKELPGQPRHQPRDQLKTENQLGPMYLRTKRTDLLLVPTARGLDGPAIPPDDALHDVDHYKCYRADDAGDRPDYFPSRAEANLRDAFEHRDYALRKQRHFCAPASQDGSVVKNPDGYLVCYSGKPSKFSNKDVERKGLHTANSFGEETLDTKRVREICVPARLLEAP